MTISFAPQVQTEALQSLNFNASNAIQLYDNTLGTDDALSILSVLQTQEGLGSTLFNKINVDLISILNEIKETDDLSLNEALKLELVFNLIDQNPQTNGVGSLTDFYAVLYLLSVLIF